MKKFTLLLIALGFALTVNAQYTIGTSTSTEGTGFSYPDGTSGATVLGIPAQETLSSWRTLPFSFSFYGQAVTGYYASDNGYITFDQAATTSVAANTSIPDAGGPNNAIYAFWDDWQVISGSGSTDEVQSWTYGTAPNRTHVIQWYSVTPPSGTGFGYMAILIHECGDFQVLNHYGSASGMSGTVGCENAAGTMGVQVTGSPNYTYPSGVGSGASDDVVYTFFDNGISYDLEVSSIDLTQFVSLGNNDVTGTIVNNGSTAITSFDLNYTVNGGSPVSATITANISANGGTYNFTHPTQWNVASGGQSFDLCVYADNLNGANNDQRTCNDQACESLFSNNNTSGTHTVLLEEFTGAWCGWCPDGAVVQEQILAANPGDVIGVSVHDGDAMEFNDGIRSGFGVSAYPNGMVDRKVFPGEPDEPHSRGSWTANANAQIGSYTPVDLSIESANWDDQTRQITVDATANFVDYAAGDIRIGLMIVEDSVTGTGTGYNQVNYLNTTSGHPYFGAGDPIIGFVHRHVLRDLPGGTYGVSGTIPGTVSPNSSYTESFTYTLPAAYDETKVSLVAFIGYYSTSVGERYLLDADEMHLPLMSGREDELAGSFVKVYPNPASSDATIKMNFSQNVHANVRMMNSVGQVVLDLGEADYFAGEHRLHTDLSAVPQGVYFLQITTDKGSLTKKVVVAH